MVWKNMTKWFDYFTIAPGETVVDLGACVGETTLYFARKVGKSGLVVALEPDIANFRVVHNLIEHLSFGGWKAHSTVLTGKRFFGTRVIPTISWNDLVDTLVIKHVDLAKINVEGAEIGSLEGMTKVFPDKIMLDDHNRFGTDGEHLERLLWEKGYEILERRDGEPPVIVKNLIYAKRA